MCSLEIGLRFAAKSQPKIQNRDFHHGKATQRAKKATMVVYFASLLGTHEQKLDPKMQSANQIENAVTMIIANSPLYTQLLVICKGI
jgi:hypothetical protein